MNKSIRVQSEAQYLQYLHMLRQNKWWIFFLTLGLSVLSAAVIVMLPNRYQASASILVDPQRVEDPGAGPGPMRSSLTDRLRSTAQEVLLSSPRLQTIMNKYRLEAELRDSASILPRRFRIPLSDEEVIDVMRKRIEISVKQSGSNSPATVFLSYEGSDPAGAAQVTNELSAQLIFWSVQGRQQQTNSTVEFLKDQLSRTKQSIDEQEKEMRDFKITHAGEMPSDVQNNLNTITQLRGMYQANNDALTRLSQEYVELTRPSSSGPGAGRSNQPLTERERLEQEKTQLQDKLQDLEKRYTSSFPEVVETRTRLRRVAEQLKGLAPESAEAREAASPNANRIESNRHSVERLNEEQKRISAQIAGLQQKIDLGPLREQQYNDLTRNYNITKQDYQTLFTKEAQAEMTASLEKEQGADRFEIIESARPPDRPTKPNRPLLSVVALFASLAAAIGVVVAKEQMSSTITSEEHLAGLLPSSVIVLASIPTIEVPKDSKRVRMIAGAAVTFLLTCGLLAAVYLWRIHPVL